MDGRSPDHGEPGRISRRSFVAGAGAAAALAAAYQIGKIGLHLPSESTEAPNVNHPIETAGKQPDPELSNFVNNHPLLVNLSGDQKKVIGFFVENEVENYAGTPKKPKDIGKRIKDSSRWTKLVSEKADNLGFKPDSFARRILPGLIFAESEGNSEKPGGLCQIEPPIAENLAEKLGIILGEKDINLLNPDVNITLALEYINRLYRLFPDPALALWGFNLGETIMANALSAYVLELSGDSEDVQNTVNKKFADPDEPATAYYTKAMGINIFSLLTSEAAIKSMRDDLKKIGEDFGDMHRYYVPKVLAGDYFIQSFQTKA